ncbi:iron complex transport system permease protein [Microbacterium halimionae]|uniref:Iron complex transport system permease protein n=1 Tax=Microbacterium halimionae TaxID=1526413 RepID=A0A7W3PM38_9MICO|nr:iron ABC transporter permease [Microbacterium halimionae]MBA8816808.1 iron complex transport system permease protein [Microbacterium halimionae]NII94896.1 iron complex transport system permease protein [Microbacterium halimionae]
MFRSSLPRQTTSVDSLAIGQRRVRGRVVVAYAVAVVALVLVGLASILVGASGLDPVTVIGAIFHYDPQSTVDLIVVQKRLPRTLVGLLVGCALGLAGAVAQGLTRNPIADPGLLGVSYGASLAVVLGTSITGAMALSGYVWFAFLGAAIASVVVFAVASLGREGATPVKLVLVGAAVSAACGSIITALLLTSRAALDTMRFWQVGAIAGRGYDVFWQMMPAVVVGVVLALLLGRQLNGLSLGDDVARGLGQRVGLTRVLGALAIVLLCGAATAAAGPIVFVGLAVPHIARAFVGPDYRRVITFSALVGPIVILGCDIIGRLIAAPGELEVGIVTAFVGAPFFIAMVRRRKLPSL